MTELENIELFFSEKNERRRRGLSASFLAEESGKAANTLMGSKWVNPSLSVLSSSTEDSTCFWVKCDSISFAYGHIFIGIYTITISSDYIEIMYTIDENFDCMYDYNGNPKNKELFT